MPTYTYRCQKCGHEFERFQSMSDEPVKRCPECKGKVLRTYHPVGIVLKGPGFHRNDYRSPSKKSSGDSRSSESSSESKSESSDSKSESKSGTSETASASGSKGESGSKESGSKGSGSKKSDGKGSKSSSDA